MTRGLLLLAVILAGSEASECEEAAGRIDLQTLADAGTITAPPFCFKVPVVADCDQYYYFSDQYNKHTLCYLDEAGACKGRLVCGPSSLPPSPSPPTMPPTPPSPPTNPPRRPPSAPRMPPLPPLPPPSSPHMPPSSPRMPPRSPAEACGAAEGRVDLLDLVQAGTITAPPFCYKVTVLADCSMRALRWTGAASRGLARPGHVASQALASA